MINFAYLAASTFAYDVIILLGLTLIVGLFLAACLNTLIFLRLPAILWWI